MRIDVKIDTTQLLLKLDHGERHLGYAAVNAINTTALRIQTAEQEHLHAKFIVRRDPFMTREVAILKKASTRDARPFAEIWVGDKARLLLSTFEHGGERRPFTPGAKSVAVPLLGRPARPSIRSLVPPAYTFAGMHLVAHEGGKRLRIQKRNRRFRDINLYSGEGRFALDRQTSDRRLQWKGQNRTFLLTQTQHEPFGGVFQRIGPARGDIREIYAFRIGIRIDDRLQFVLTALQVADRWFHEDLQRATIDELQHAGLIA